MNFQSLQNLENYNSISKKISCGPDLPWTGPIRRESGPDPPATDCLVDEEDYSSLFPAMLLVRGE
jgi:hypothetical protein